MLPLAEKQRKEELAEQQRQDKKKKLCPEPEEYVTAAYYTHIYTHNIIISNFFNFER